MNRSSGVTAPAGFRAAGLAAGIKPSGALDMTLVVNDGPSAVAAGVFTRNKVKAAPVLWSQQVLQQQSLRAVVLNSGGANACTGPEGFQDTHATAERVAAKLGIGAVEVAVCSTGLIGERLPMPKVLSGVDSLVAGLGRGYETDLDAATAVMTTDTVAKQVSATDGFTIGGFAKGAGMCAPNMATMLSILTTDAKLSAADADAALRAAVDKTFNRLDVDGGTSTNDTVLLLSSGVHDADPAEFAAALTEVCADLVAAAPGRRGRRDQARADHRAGRGERGRRAGHGAHRRRGQPLQDRVLRRRPELGPDRDGRRQRARRVRPPAAGHRPQRRDRVPRGRAR